MPSIALDNNGNPIEVFLAQGVSIWAWLSSSIPGDGLSSVSIPPLVAWEPLPIVTQDLYQGYVEFSYDISTCNISLVNNAPIITYVKHITNTSSTPANIAQSPSYAFGFLYSVLP